MLTKTTNIHILENTRYTVYGISGYNQDYTTYDETLMGLEQLCHNYSIA